MHSYAYGLLVVAYMAGCYEHLSLDSVLCLLGYTILYLSHKKSADGQEGKKN